MPGIRPFHDALVPVSAQSHVPPADVSNLLCPPYDVTDAGLAARLVAADPDNAAVLEAPRSVFATLPPDQADRRARAALQDRIAAKALRPWPRPACMITRLTFRLGELVHRRLGLTALVPVDDTASPGRPDRGLLSHEERSPNLEENRFEHLRTLRCQTSPVLALFDDCYGDVEQCLRRHIISNEPVMHARAPDGAVHEAWMMDDAHEINLVQHAFGNRPVVIADGHNRYKAHRRYLDGLDHAGHDHPARWCLANLVACQDDGLCVRSVYHLFAGMREYTFDSLLQKAATFANAQLVVAPLERLLEHVHDAWLAGSHPIGLHDFESGRSAVLTTRQVDPLALTHANRPEAWRRADSVILEHLLVRPILRVQFNRGQPITCRAVNEPAMVRSLAAPTLNPQLAAVVLPVAASTIIELASIHCLLPPLTASIWPAFPAGLVYYPLE